MNKKTIILICGLLFSIILAVSSCISTGDAQAAPYAPRDMVFKNVNIIPMTEETVLKNRSVFVSDGKIKQIGSFADLNYPEGTQIIDAGGKYLSPGFSDMHAHGADEATRRHMLLANGVTLIRNMHGYPEVLEIREQINQKQAAGPEIYTTSPIVDAGSMYGEGMIVLQDKEEAEEVVKKIHADGYDAVKIYDNLTLEVYTEILRAAKEIDIPVVGHIPFKVSVETALTSGQLSNEHLRGYAYSAGIDNIPEIIELTTKSGMWNCPTLIVLKSLQNPRAAKKNTEYLHKFMDPVTEATWKFASSNYSNYEEAQRLIKVLYDKGANIVAGTDMGIAYVFPGYSLHDELQLLNEAGLTPYETLLTTTINAARMLGFEDRLGTIEVGKDADLVLLEKNPLEDINNTRTIAGVMTKGTWFSPQALQTMLDDIAKKVAEMRSK